MLLFVHLFTVKYILIQITKKAKHDSLIYMTYYCSEKIAAIKNPSFSVTEQLLNNCEQYACYNYGHGFLVFLLFLFIM